MPDRYQSINFGLFFSVRVEGNSERSVSFFMFVYIENMMYGYTTIYGDGCKLDSNIIIYIVLIFSHDENFEDLLLAAFKM